MIVQLYNKISLYFKDTNKTQFYGQHHQNYPFEKLIITLDNNKYDMIKEKRCCFYPNSGKAKSYEFVLLLPGKLKLIQKMEFFYKDNSKNFTWTNVQIEYPFDSCNIKLNQNSAIITTMAKDYGHRLDEWIQYNLKIGFSGIIIFDNSDNKGNKLNEPMNNSNNSLTIKDICNKYPDKVFRVHFPFIAIPPLHWNHMQRVSMALGLHAFKNKVRNIALIDPDEFIFNPKNKNLSIERFLDKYNKTIQIGSNILTNKSNDDLINNNILKMDLYLGEKKYNKLIVHTSTIDSYFRFCPHNKPGQLVVPNTDLIHYHIWINKRCQYEPSMPLHNVLRY